MQLADELKKYGLTLSNYASIREQSVGGFIQVKFFAANKQHPLRVPLWSLGCVWQQHCQRWRASAVQAGSLSHVDSHPACCLWPVALKLDKPQLMHAMPCAGERAWHGREHSAGG